MNKLSVNLENCFGINKMNHDFDFSDYNTKVIYASNGVMKTSFANTFKQIETGGVPSDRLYGRPTVCDIQVDNSPISKDLVVVIKSFENINTEGSQSKLLVDQTSKEEYDGIFSSILDLKKKLIADLNKLSGVKQVDLEAQLVLDFGNKEFYTILSDVVNEGVPTDFSEISYSEVFNKDVVDFLKKPNVKSNIELYFTKYKALLEQSTLYKAGVFNPDKADNIASTLKKENFFEAEHKVQLKGVDESFGSFTSLNQKLLDEKQEIIGNSELLEIENQIKKVAVKKFKALLEKSDIIAEFANLEAFKVKLWKSYLYKNLFHITELLAVYTAGKERLSEIEHNATVQETIWDDVIRKFNGRFFVPFTVSIQNKASAILGRSVPNIQFNFKDLVTGQEAVLLKDELGSREILSQGEKRAMYLLNVMFNIEVRRKDGLESLFIIDDIADSFDYKNKYAIIQYLQDLTLESNFYQIILTHNFDFLRTLQSRVLGGRHRRNSSFMAQKDNGSIQLIGSGHNYQDNPFKHWKSHLSNKQMLIASIPFVRNLIEYKSDESSSEYVILTALLHEKDTSRSIKVKDLKVIFDQVIESTGLEELNEEESIHEILDQEITTIIDGAASNGINLEEKIVLSIGIRLKAEQYMWSKVEDKTPFDKYQTQRLFKRFKDEYGTSESSAIETIDQVNLITPENIHVNSFMFEPILDLSLDHLKRLFNEVNALTLS